MYAEEKAACDHVAFVLNDYDPPGFKGRHVLELGSGRGACLRYAATELGAGRVTGIDVLPGSVEATMRCTLILLPLVPEISAAPAT